MPVLLLVVAVAILAGVVAVASGRGGEMAVPEPDYPPIDLGPVSAADVALLRPPSAAWGYNMRVTDEALEVIARAVTERDVQIAALQQQVSDLRDRLGGETGPAFAASSAGTAAELDDMGPAEYLDSSGYREAPEYQDAPRYPEGPGFPEPAAYRGELDDPLTTAGPADAEAAAETGPEPDAEPGEPAHEPVAPWPGEDVPHVPGSGSGPAAPVAITRPQPIYRRPAGHDDGLGQPGRAGITGEQPALRPAGPSAPSAPWGPARPPGEAAPPWDEPGAAAPTAPDDHGWGTDPADTSPDAQAVDWAAAAPPPTGAEPTPPSGLPAADPDPTDWDGRSQPSPAPSVWDVASRQVDEDQTRRPPRPGDHAGFIWDEEPHQTVVWGAEHARAKAARVADETLPNAEQSRDDERG